MYMLKSPEGITFNHVDLQERFTDADNALYDYFMINDVAGRGVNGKEIELITVSNNDGAYVEGGRKPPRYLDVTITVKSPSFSDLRRKIDELNDILNTSEDVPIVFDDETDMTYYGRLDSVNNLTEEHKIYQAVLTFLCSDPYKYGPEVAKDLGDIDTVNNEGTAPADPIFELTAKEKTTFAMISNGADEDAEYNLIGTPADDDVEVVDTKSSVLYEDGGTIDEWEPALKDMIDDPNVESVSGTMGTDGAGIRVNTYGPTTDKGQRGSAIYKELSNSIQDFELETTFDIISNREIENWRMAIYLYDENMNRLGQIGVKDNSRVYKRRVPLATEGPHSAGYNKGRVFGDQSDFNNNARNTTLFYLRAKREGDTFSFYIGEWQSYKYINVWEGTYKDIAEEYLGRLKYVALFIGSYQDRPIPSRLRMNSVELSELTQVTVDQTPYILYPGDKVRFDHKDDDILVNGESIMGVKNHTIRKAFGASFFNIKKGYNSIIIYPRDTFDAEAKWSDKYL